uniref:Tumor protein p53-inducible protein 11 n=1 Tax=Callorhinchus milii TaxID=7868 RepID=V9KRS5_CALMI
MADKIRSSLLKKHSQSDLVSRLKSRKVLGVGGEDDEGEVHRSKISQVLGNELKFTLYEPFGLRCWQLVSAVLFTLTGILALTFPGTLRGWLYQEESVHSCQTPLRLYGGALLSIGLILINSFYTSEKVIIRWSLQVEAFSATVQCVASLVGMMERGSFPLEAAVVLACQGLIPIISALYCFQLGRRPKKI